jgi:hypothetical protein
LVSPWDPSSESFYSKRRFSSRSAGVAAIIVLLSCWTLKGQGERRDGNWWNTLPPAAKSYYILGALDGTSLGSAFTYPPVVEVNGKETPNSAAARNKAADLFDANAMRYIANLKAGQIRDGLDEFYKDFRNRAIMLRGALEVVLRQIAGEDVNQMVMAFRAIK